MNTMPEYESFRPEKIKDGGWYAGIVFCLTTDKVPGNLVVGHPTFKAAQSLYFAGVILVTYKITFQLKET